MRADRSREFAVTRTSLDGGVDVVRVAGELDAFTASRLRDAVAQIPAGDAVVFDLSDVHFIDSSGLGALIGSVRRVRETGGRVSVASSRATVAELLHVTGLDRLAPLHHSIDAANAALTEGEGEHEERPAPLL